MTYTWFKNDLSDGQWYLLGPVPFTIYINYVFSLLSNCNFHLYKDLIENSHEIAQESCKLPSFCYRHHLKTQKRNGCCSYMRVIHALIFIFSRYMVPILNFNINILAFELLINLHSTSGIILSKKSSNLSKRSIDLQKQIGWSCFMSVFRLKWYNLQACLCFHCWTTRLYLTFCPDLSLEQHHNPLYSLGGCTSLRQRCVMCFLFIYMAHW